MESTTPNRELHEMTAYLVLLSFQLLKVNKNELEWLGEHLKCTFSQLTSYGRIDTGEIKMYNVELCNQIRSHLNISDNELLCELNSGPLVCNDTHTAWYSHRRRIVLKYVDESSIVRLQTNFKKYAEYMLLHGMTTHLDRIINFIRVTRGNVAVYFVVSITPYPIIGCELVHAIKLNCIPHQFIETKTNKQHQRNNNGNANGNGLSKMMSSLLHKDKQPSDIKTNENKLKNLIYYGEMVDDTYFNENYVDNIALHNTLVEKPETSSCVPSEVWAGIENNDKQTPDKSGSIESSNINVDNIILQTKPNTSLTPPLESVEYGPNENKWYTDIEGVNKLAYMAKANTEPNQLMMDDALIVLEAISKEPISEARKNGRYVACVDFESVCENIHADHLKSLEVDADVEYSIELGSSDRRTLLSELKEDIAFIESIMGYKYSLQCVAIKRLTEGKLTAPGGVFGPNVSEAMNPSSQRNTFVARHDRDYSDQFQPHFSEFHIPINRKLVTPEEDPYWLYTNKTPQCIPKAYFSKRRKDVEFHFSFDNIFESYEIEDRFKKYGDIFVKMATNMGKVPEHTLMRPHTYSAKLFDTIQRDLIITTDVDEDAIENGYVSVVVEKQTNAAIPSTSKDTVAVTSTEVHKPISSAFSKFTSVFSQNKNNNSNNIHSNVISQVSKENNKNTIDKNHKDPSESGSESDADSNGEDSDYLHYRRGNV